MRSADVVALALAGVVAAVAIVSIAPDAPAKPAVGRVRFVTPSGPACPLTPQQEQKAVDIFHDKLMPVLTHPRCLNCHGGVDPFRDKDEGGHIGGEMDSTKSGECVFCHRLKGWGLPHPAMMWVGKSERELCILFKQMEGSPSVFVGHVTNENLPNAPEHHLARAAFVGDGALNDTGRAVYKDEMGVPPRADPPPGTHGDFIAHSREWANTIGNGWKVFPDCGCRVRAATWEGTVEATYTLRNTALGVLTEKTISTVHFELDSTMINDGDPTRYWQSTSGVIRWSVTMTGGECTASAAGIVPVGLGADLNPMSSLQLSPRPDNSVAYSVSIGPWPDAYTPRFNWKCKSEPRIRPGMAYTLNTWWLHDHPVTLSPDGKTMKGTHRSSPGGVGEMEWRWDLRLVDPR